MAKDKLAVRSRLQSRHLIRFGVQLSLHDFADALETAEQAVAINPYNAQIYGALVDANVEMGRYETALAYAEKAYDKRPENIDVNRLMGKIYKRMGKDDMAMEHLARASRTNAQYPELKALLASRFEG